MQQVREALTEDEVRAALLELVGDGVLEMGVNDDGDALFWFADEVAD